MELHIEQVTLFNFSDFSSLYANHIEAQIKEERLRNIYSKITGNNSIIFQIKLDSGVIGHVELGDINYNSAMVYDYFIADDKRGLGIGVCALRELSKYVFEELKLNTLFVAVYYDNIRAIRCYEKSGFLMLECLEEVGYKLAYKLELNKDRFYHLVNCDYYYYYMLS